MRIELLADAEEDLFRGFEFYERQAPSAKRQAPSAKRQAPSAGRGAVFSGFAFPDIDSLQLYAGIHSLHLGYHRKLATRFPYAIYYTVDGDRVRVYAVLDCRQSESGTWRRFTVDE